MVELVQQLLLQQLADRGEELDITKVARLVIPPLFPHLKEAMAALALAQELVQIMAVEAAEALEELVLMEQAQQAETAALDQYLQLAGHL